jgi:hypothetical protein
LDKNGQVVFVFEIDGKVMKGDFSSSSIKKLVFQGEPYYIPT